MCRNPTTVPKQSRHGSDLLISSAFRFCAESPSSSRVGMSSPSLFMLHVFPSSDMELDGRNGASSAVCEVDGKVHVHVGGGRQKKSD